MLDNSAYSFSQQCRGLRCNSELSQATPVTASVMADPGRSTSSTTSSTTIQQHDEQHDEQHREQHREQHHEQHHEQHDEQHNRRSTAEAAIEQVLVRTVYESDQRVWLQHGWVRAVTVLECPRFDEILCFWCGKRQSVLFGDEWTWIKVCRDTEALEEYCTLEVVRWQGFFWVMMCCNCVVDLVVAGVDDRAAQRLRPHSRQLQLRSDNVYCSRTFAPRIIP